jgi:hypothetical protein
MNVRVISAVTSRFQGRVMREMHAPAGICCPVCNHDYDVTVSRAQLNMPRWQRLVFRCFRCGVCDCRFSTLNPAMVQRIAGVGFCVATAIVTVIATVTWS